MTAEDWLRQAREALARAHALEQAGRHEEAKAAGYRAANKLALALRVSGNVVQLNREGTP